MATDEIVEDHSLCEYDTSPSGSSVTEVLQFDMIDSPGDKEVDVQIEIAE